MRTHFPFQYIRKITHLPTFELTRKRSLVFILIFTTIIILDSTIPKFSSYSGIEPSTSMNMVIYFTLSVTFLVANILLINTVRLMTSKFKFNYARIGLRYFHGFIISVQAASVGVMFIILFQMILMNAYSVYLLRIATYLTHVSSLVLLSFLVFLFAGWIFSKANYLMILYSISFSLVAVNLVISLLYLDAYFTMSVLPDVRSHSIVAYVANIGGSVFTVSLSRVFSFLSLASFLLMWLATAILLSQYRYRMGNLRYFGLMSIPLVYYTFPLQGYSGDILFPLLITFPVAFSVIYVLLFSATKQVGAVLFSLAFLSASSVVHSVAIRRYVLLSAIGMTLLFGSIEITPLQYRAYPPYGLVTQALTPLGAYLLLIGIFVSAKQISQSAEVRKQFYKSASSQLNLLRTIGVSQMEKEYEERIKSIEESLSSMRSELHSEEPLKEENVKEILREVLNELYYSKGEKEPQDK